MNIYLAEFIGTALLILIGCGVNAGVSLSKSYAQNSGWIVIAIGWGLAVTFAIYAVGSISGAHINPAVTLGLAIAGEFSWSLVPGYVFAQVLGAGFGATLVWLQYLAHWKKTADSATKLGVFSTSPAVPSTFANLFSEMLATFVLLFGLMFIGANNFTEGLNPLVVGILIVSIGLSLGGTTGYAINPARDLGPRIAHFLLPISGKGDSNWKYSWIPVAGPIIGGMLGSLTYLILFKSIMNPVYYALLGIALIIIIMAVYEQKKNE